MKKLLTIAALGLALVAGGASADKLVLMDSQLDNVSAAGARHHRHHRGSADASADADAYASGRRVSATTYTYTDTYRIGHTWYADASSSSDSSSR